MDLDDFNITIFCRIDEALPHVTAGRRIRDRTRAARYSRRI
jgi:hypothetical protein